MSNELSDWLIVIPSRLGSTRLPEKSLADLGGKPLVVRVYDRTRALRDLGAKVIVATDSDRILSVCREHKVPAEMTSLEHQSGSDRCAEVAGRHSADFIMNVQGDEPFIDGEDLLRLARLLTRRPFVGMGTLAAPLRDPKLFHDSNVVKVVLTRDQRALYFSRSPIPWSKEDAAEFWGHVGIYAFRRDALQDFIKFPRSDLEARESLEQLRALDHGMEIVVERASRLSLNINTLQDLEEARRHFTADKGN